MKLILRKYQGENDYWKARAFLREVFLLNDRRQLSWDICRFDYWRWHGVANLETDHLEDVLHFWETTDGRIAAILNPEGNGHTFLHLHPQIRTPDLEEEMVQIAEEALSIPTEDNRRRVTVWVVGQRSKQPTESHRSCRGNPAKFLLYEDPVPSGDPVELRECLGKEHCPLCFSR